MLTGEKEGMEMTAFLPARQVRDEAKARLVPLYFGAEDDRLFAAQVERLRELLAEVATLLPARPLGASVAGADAALLPQLTGEAYRRKAELAQLEAPVLVLTSEFGTMAMWDWELISYLRDEGIDALAPYSLGSAHTACRALATKRQLSTGKFVVYWDRPGDGGQQPGIFKRFYWWESECADRMAAKFGVTIEKRSFAELGAAAKSLPDRDAIEQQERWREIVPLGDVSARASMSAFKLYEAVRRDIEQDKDVLAAGINCLNESSFSDSTPCLAWNLLYQESDLIWGCEADLVSMVTKLILHRSLRAPVMMTNLYPFLMGQAALQHERIPAFPTVPGRPEDYVLAAHCGYLGVLPQPFAAEWSLRERVLAIVDDNASAIDARLPLGPLTLAKLGPSFANMVIAEGELTGYAGYPGSDCRNGALIKVRDGNGLMERLPSHHSVLVGGHDLPGIKLVGRVFGLDIEIVGAAAA
jgi:hypothetical protein